MLKESNQVKSEREKRNKIELKSLIRLLISRENYSSKLDIFFFFFFFFFLCIHYFLGSNNLGILFQNFFYIYFVVIEIKYNITNSLCDLELIKKKIFVFHCEFWNSNFYFIYLEFDFYFCCILIFKITFAHYMWFHNFPSPQLLPI